MFCSKNKTWVTSIFKKYFGVKRAVPRGDMALAEEFFDSCISFNALNLSFAQKSIDVVATISPSYELPSYHRIFNQPNDYKEDCKLHVESYRHC